MKRGMQTQQDPLTHVAELPMSCITQLSPSYTNKWGCPPPHHDVGVTMARCIVMG